MMRMLVSTSKLILFNHKKNKYSNKFHSSAFVLGINDFKDIKLGENERSIRSGRAWHASDLRRKSFDDLHKLWYVLYKERNVMLTLREKYRAVDRSFNQLDLKRYLNVKKSMAAIKLVLAERRKFKEFLQEQEEAASAILKDDASIDNDSIINTDTAIDGEKEKDNVK